MVERIAALIVNYRSADLVRRCMASLGGADGLDVLVLDNSADDDAAAALRDVLRSFPDARLVVAEANLGFAAGVNRLICEAGDAYGAYWLLNPDVVVAEGCLAQLRQELAEDPDRMLSPLITMGDGAEERVWFDGGEVDVERGIVRHLGYGGRAATTRGATHPSAFLTAAALLVPAPVLSVLGPLREDLFLYWEDVEYSLRARAHGFALAVVPTARARHDEGGTSSTGDGGRSAVHYRWMARNRLVVCAAARGGAWLRPLFARATIAGILRPLRRERRGRWAKTWAAARGTLAGIRAVIRR
jgi:GT2 family glycosyltransferase